MKALWRFFFPKWARAQADRRVDEGVVFFEAGELDRAVSCYEEAILWAPEHEWAHANLGLSLVDQYNTSFEDWPDERRKAHLTLALDTLSHAIELGAKRVAVFRAFGHLHWRLGHYQKAANAFEKALGLLVEDDAKEECEVLESYLEELRPAIDKAVQVGQVLNVVNNSKADQEECQYALSLVTHFLEEEEDIQFLWLAGVLQRRVGDLKSAKANFLKILAHKESHLESHRELAQIFLHEETFELALEHSMAAYRLSPRDAGLVCNVGVCHLALENRDKAQEFIELAHGMEPHSPIINKALDALKIRA